MSDEIRTEKEEHNLALFKILGHLQSSVCSMIIDLPIALAFQENKEVLKMVEYNMSII